MSKILVVGNLLKDVYLKFDGEKAGLETDEVGVRWLDLGFDQRAVKYFQRTSLYGGASVVVEALANFGHEVQMADVKLAWQNGELSVKTDKELDYRYILCHEEKGVAYLVPEERRKTVWKIPDSGVEWLVVDSSANVDLKTVQEIKGYLSMAQKTRLALLLPRKQNLALNELAEVANLIFIDSESEWKKTELQQKTRAMICTMTENAVELGRAKRFFKTERTHLMTHVTLRGMMAGTILGALINGESDVRALSFAKFNAERATLDKGLTLKTLEELAKAEAEKADVTLVAKELVAGQKGILAADESGGSIHKKFAALGIPDTEQTRRDYRNIFLSTTGLENYVNGVILFDETARRKADNGQTFVQWLASLGVIAGIKVDQGLEKFPESEETWTKGLEGLELRLEEYYQMGLRFAKWRAAFTVGEGTPSQQAIERNCEILAQYARCCQEAHIVPIVEPEVVHDGDYTIEKCAQVTGEVLDSLFHHLSLADVDLAGCILKCNMVLAGKRYARPSTAAEVGRQTAEVLKKHVPSELAGVVFLSGGQSVEQATENLAAVKREGGFPWPVTFSFARALQEPALEVWRGDNRMAGEAKKAFKARLVANTEVL